MAQTLAGYATQLNPTTQIVCAYASGATTLKARAGAARWVVIGTFRVPEYVGEAHLQVEGLCTTNATCQVALFGPEQVTGSNLSLTVGGREQVNLTLQTFALQPNVTYQIAACVQTAVEANNRFAVIRTVSLV